MVKQEDRQALRREKSIERLMRAGVEMLGHKSYSAIRVEDITIRAGMAKGSLYMYFEGKEELYVKAVSELFLKPMDIRFREIMGNKDPRQVLLATVEESFDVARKQDEFEMLLRAVMDKSLLELIREELESFMERYLRLVEDCFRALGHENPGQRAYLFFVLLDGLITYRFLELVGDEHWKSKAAADRLKSELLRMFDLM